MDTSIIGCNNSGITSATDTFMALYGGTSSVTVTPSVSGFVIMPIAGTFKNLYISCDAGPGAGITRTFSVNKNGTDTGITISLTGSGTGVGVSSGSDIVHTAAFVAGDTISLHTSATATSTSTGTIRWGMAASASVNQSMILGNSNTNLSTSVTSYVALSGKGLDTTSGTNVQGVMPTAGTLKNAYLTLGTSNTPGAGASYVATLYQNGSPTTIVMTVSGSSTSTASDTSHTVTVAAGDTLYWSIAPSSTPTAQTVAISLEFDPTINGESVHMYGSSVVDTNSAVRYNAVCSPGQSSFQSSEPPRQSLTTLAVWSKLYVNLASSPGGAASFQVQLTVGAVAGSPSVTISGSNTTASDTSAKAASAGQTVAIKLTPSGSPTASTLSWGIVSSLGLVPLPHFQF